jgi:hypothetical protein
LGCRRQGRVERFVVISWFFSSFVEDNEELGGLLSFLGFFLKCKKQWWVVILACHYS